MVICLLLGTLAVAACGAFERDKEVHASDAAAVMAPVIVSPPVTKAVMDFPYAYVVVAAAVPEATITVYNPPNWMQVNGTNLSGTPTVNDLGITSMITIVARNGIGEEAVQQFAIEVMGANPPEITSTPVTTAMVGRYYVYTIVASGAPVPELAVTGLPDWLSFDSDAGSIEGTPRAIHEGTTGTITVTASNGVEPNTVQTFSIDVQPKVFTGWETFTVWDPPDADAGGHTSIAVESSGRVNIIFYDETGDDGNPGALRHIWSALETPWPERLIDESGDSGTYNDLTISPDGALCCSYINYDDHALRFAWFTGSLWRLRPVTFARWHTSLKIDAAGIVHFSHYDWTLDANNDVVEDESGLMYSSIALTDLMDNTTVPVTTVIENTGNFGNGGSLALDSEGLPSIAYFFSYTNDLKLAQHDATGESWQTLAVEVSPDTRVGSDATLVIDHEDHKHILYYDSDNFDLKYATDQSGAWVIETVDSASKVGLFSSAKFDPFGVLHVSYYDEELGDLRHAWRSTEGVWSTETVDSTGDVGAYSSLDVDEFGQVHVSYLDRSNHTIKYAVYR